MKCAGLGTAGRRGVVVLLTAASVGDAKTDFETSLCLDLRPFECAACFAGGGAVASSCDEPVLVPMLIGGLRVGSRRFGALVCAEIHLKPEDTDTMLWTALVFSFEYPKRK